MCVFVKVDLYEAVIRALHYYYKNHIEIWTAIACYTLTNHVALQGTLLS
jgi:hypothetical protein